MPSHLKVTNSTASSQSSAANDPALEQCDTPRKSSLRAPAVLPGPLSALKNFFREPPPTPRRYFENKKVPKSKAEEMSKQIYAKYIEVTSDMKALQADTGLAGNAASQADYMWYFGTSMAAAVGAYALSSLSD